MENKTESYIVLKPIAERFARVASEITDDEIRSLIKSEMRDQLKAVNFNRWVGGILEEWVDDNAETIRTLAATCLAERMR